MLLLVGGIVGCGGGSRDANIALRKQVQTLQDENDRLEAQLAGARAAETRAEQPDVEADEDAFLFVTDRIEFGRLTGGFDEDPDQPGDELLQVYVQPVDQFGDEFKAAGTFTVTATTDDADSRQLGQWTFTAAEAADSWRNRFTIYGYVLDCPLDGIDYRGDIVVRAEFTESLTGQTFDAKTDAGIE